MTYTVFGNGDKKKNILNSFYEGIQDFCDQNDPQWFEEIKERLKHYSVAVMTYYNDESSADANKLGPGYFVGNTFSNNLANEGNIEISHIGATCFTGCCTRIKGILNSLNIT